MAFRSPCCDRELREGEIEEGGAKSQRSKEAKVHCSDQFPNPKHAMFPDGQTFNASSPYVMQEMIAPGQRTSFHQEGLCAGA